MLGIVGFFMCVSVSQADDKWTTIKGRAVLDSKAVIPVMAPIKVDKDKDACLAKGAFTEETWVINPKNKGIANVFVWIEPEPAPGGKFVRGKPFPKALINPTLGNQKLKEGEIDQPCCKFIPHCLALQEGTNLTIKNSAPVNHNAKIDAENFSINPLLAPKGSYTQKNLKAEKNAIPVSCSIHPYMKAWVRVFDHPYFAITDKDGNFEIKDAPVGKFRLMMWHETGWRNGRAGIAGTPIENKSGKVTDLKELTFQLPK